MWIKLQDALVNLDRVQSIEIFGTGLVVHYEANRRTYIDFGGREEAAKALDRLAALVIEDEDA